MQPGTKVAVGILSSCGLALFITLVILIGLGLNEGGEGRRGSPASDDDHTDLVSVEVLRAEVWSLRTHLPGGLIGTFKERYGFVLVRITNLSASKRCHFTSWNTPSSHPRLRDAQGNDYLRPDFRDGEAPEWWEPQKNNPDKWEPVSDPLHIAIDPGRNLTLPVIFESPIKSATDFTLELPKANVGGTGTFRLTFHSSFPDR